MDEQNVQSMEMTETATTDVREEIATEIAKITERGVVVDYDMPLPETEFDVMMAVWSGEIPVTTNYLMQVLGNSRGWKVPTLISFLCRLENRGYVGSIKKGRERLYFPLADRITYLQQATKRFAERYHNSSLVSILEALYPAGSLPEAEIDGFLSWLNPQV